MLAMTAMTVKTEGQNFESPSVYLNPMAQAVSRKPEMINRIQAMTHLKKVARDHCLVRQFVVIRFARDRGHELPELYFCFARFAYVRPRTLTISVRTSSGSMLFCLR